MNYYTKDVNYWLSKVFSNGPKETHEGYNYFNVYLRDER